MEFASGAVFAAQFLESCWIAAQKGGIGSCVIRVQDCRFNLLFVRQGEERIFRWRNGYARHTVISEGVNPEESAEGSYALQSGVGLAVGGVSGDMWGGFEGIVHQKAVDIGFIAPYVEDNLLRALFINGVFKGVFVDDLAARGVNEYRAFFHIAEKLFIGKVDIASAAGDMNGNDIGIVQKFAEAGEPLRSFGGHTRRVVQDGIESEDLRGFCDAPSDLAHADHANSHTRSSIFDEARSDILCDAVGVASGSVVPCDTILLEERYVEVVESDGGGGDEFNS